MSCIRWFIMMFIRNNTIMGQGIHNDGVDEDYGDDDDIAALGKL